MPTLEPNVINFPIEPLAGMYGLIPSNKIPLGGSPDMLNCYVRGQLLCKRPGYSRLGDQVSSTERVMGIFSAFDEDDNVFLFATTQTGLKRYVLASDTWLAYTGPALTGGDDHLFSWEVSQNSVVFCQGVDQVMRVPFTGTSYAILHADCPPARYLNRFADRLYLGHTVESGAQKPFRIRRSVNQDHTDWTGLGSGFNDLSEFPYHIRGMKKHGAQLLICSEQAIWVAARTGIAAAPARFDPVVAGAGNYCPYTLTTHINDQLMMGRDHFLLFTGSRTTTIGDQIRDSAYFNLEHEKIQHNFSVLRPETQEWIVFVCESGEVTPGHAWVWNRPHNIWYRWEFNDPTGSPVCGTVHRQQAPRTWDGLVGTWDAQTWQWNSSEGGANAPIVVTGATNGYVSKWKDEYLSDDGAPILARWTSRDFTSADLGGSTHNLKKLMLRSLVVEYVANTVGATLNFYLSTDAGANWSGPYALWLDPYDQGVHTVVLSEKITGDRIRWKFEHSSATETFQISRFIPEFEILGMPITSE